jgi:epoxyqueuosine reductase
MGSLSAAELMKLMEKFGERVDAVAVLPLLDLKAPLKQALGRLQQGFIPPTYGWTEEKTRLAYAYRGEGSWARSIVVAAKYYFTDEHHPDQVGYGKIARYTWRNNYRFLTLRIRNILTRLEEALGIRIRAKLYSNYTSIPEKVLCAGSGLASVGKNCVLIHKNMGSFFVVGEALTDLELDFAGTPFEENRAPAPPDFAICGECTRCIDACPTGALVGAGKLDVTRCLQYLSENLIPVSRQIREIWGDRLYGCTTCMDVCPHNANLSPWGEKHDIGCVGTGEDLISLLSYSPAEWEKRFQDNQIIMRDRLAIVQNALICLGTVHRQAPPDLIAPYLSHENWIMRVAAAWALGRNKTARSRRLLEGRFAQEKHPAVREEIALFL